MLGTPAYNKRFEVRIVMIDCQSYLAVMKMMDHWLKLSISDYSDLSVIAMIDQILKWPIID